MQKIRTSVASAASTANAMDIVVDISGEIVVDHVSHVRNIFFLSVSNPASGKKKNNV